MVIYHFWPLGGALYVGIRICCEPMTMCQMGGSVQPPPPTTRRLPIYIPYEWPLLSPVPFALLPYDPIWINESSPYTDMTPGLCFTHSGDVCLSSRRWAASWGGGACAGWWRALPAIDLDRREVVWIGLISCHSLEYWPIEERSGWWAGAKEVSFPGAWSARIPEMSEIGTHAMNGECWCLMGAIRGNI